MASREVSFGSYAKSSTSVSGDDLCF